MFYFENNHFTRGKRLNKMQCSKNPRVRMIRGYVSLQVIKFIRTCIHNCRIKIF